MKKRKALKQGFISFPYNPELKQYSRILRNNSTKGEIKFWCELLRQGKSGYTFNRQKILLNYIVDFYCARLKLIIEIDGTSHSDKKGYDKARDEKLKSFVLKIIRYDDLTVINDFEKIEKDFNNQIKLRAEEMSKRSLPFRKRETDFLT